MTLEDLRKLDVFQTRTIAAACEDNPETHNYIVSCLERFYSGDYGEIDAEDTAYNNQDLEAGEGHVLARYKEKYNLDGDFYIEAHFSATVAGIDANNVMIMYPMER